MRRKYYPLLVKEDIDIVIEGFPRSANTFAVIAFESAQQSPQKIAHHLHSESQVVLGVRLEKPVILLIRHPKDAVASLLLRAPAVSPSQALKRYERFYSNIEALLPSVVLATFEEVTSDFSRVISRVNDRFGVSFSCYRNSEQQDDVIFKSISELNRKQFRGDKRMVARPLLEKNDPLKVIGDSLTGRRDLDRCIKLYQRLIRADKQTSARPLRPD